MSKNQMADYEIFIGTWNTSGEVLAVDDALPTVLTATDTYRWLPGKHFILHEVDARFGSSVTRSTEIMGFDKRSKTYLGRSFDDRGGSEVFELDLNSKKWSISGESVRFDGKFNARGNKLSGLWEMKSKKNGWQPWIKLLLERS